MADLGGRARRTPPLRVQILSFWHTKFVKRNRLGSPRPPLRGPRPPYGKSWIRHWVVLQVELLIPWQNVVCVCVCVYAHAIARCCHNFAECLLIGPCYNHKPEKIWKCTFESEGLSDPNEIVQIATSKK